VYIVRDGYYHGGTERIKQRATYHGAGVFLSRGSDNAFLVHADGGNGRRQDRLVTSKKVNLID
jgi:hypothetical protein